uniref:Homeobox domain-containing protein n=1 Tax=Ditylenchus dipsaci TaxID=166011 RepID=A0A915ESA7_9BILA
MQASQEENCINSQRRLRTNFSEYQSRALELSFQQSHYPEQAVKREMALKLRLPEDRITVWFQNRRAKWRRKESRQRDKLTAMSIKPANNFDQTQKIVNFQNLGRCMAVNRAAITQ